VCIYRVESTIAGLSSRWEWVDPVVRVDPVVQEEARTRLHAWALGLPDDFPSSMSPSRQTGVALLEATVSWWRRIEERDAGVVVHPATLRVLNVRYGPNPAPADAPRLPMIELVEFARADLSA
jgi:hypothetical protein